MRRTLISSDLFLSGVGHLQSTATAALHHLTDLEGDGAFYDAVVNLATTFNGISTPEQGPSPALQGAVNALKTIFSTLGESAEYCDKVFVEWLGSLIEVMRRDGDDSIFKSPGEGRKPRSDGTTGSATYAHHHHQLGQQQAPWTRVTTMVATNNVEASFTPCECFEIMLRVVPTLVKVLELSHNIPLFEAREAQRAISSFLYHIIISLAEVPSDGVVYVSNPVTAGSPNRGTTHHSPQKDQPTASHEDSTVVTFREILCLAVQPHLPFLINAAILQMKAIQRKEVSIGGCPPIGLVHESNKPNRASKMSVHAVSLSVADDYFWMCVFTLSMLGSSKIVSFIAGLRMGAVDAPSSNESLLTEEPFIRVLLDGIVGAIAFANRILLSKTMSRNNLATAMAAAETSFPLPVLRVFFEQDQVTKSRQAEEARSDLPPSAFAAIVDADGQATTSTPRKRRLFAGAVEDPKQEWRMRSDEVAFIAHLCSTLSRITSSFTGLVDIGLVTMAWAAVAWGAMTASMIRFRNPDEDAAAAKKKRGYSSSPRRTSVGQSDTVTWSDDDGEVKELLITEPQDHTHTLLNATMTICIALASKELVSYVHAERFTDCLQQASNATVFTSVAWSMYLGQLRCYDAAETAHREEESKAFSQRHEPVIGRLLLKIFTPLLQRHHVSAKAESSSAIRMHMEMEEDRRLQYRSTVAFVRAMEESHRLIHVYKRCITNVATLPLSFGTMSSNAVTSPLSLLQTLLTKISEDVAANVLYVQQQQQRVRWEAEQQQNINKASGVDNSRTLLMTDLRQTSVPWHVPFWRECVRICTLLGNLLEASGGNRQRGGGYYSRQNEHEGYWSLATSMVRLLPPECSGFEHDEFGGAHLSGEARSEAIKGAMQAAFNPMEAIPSTKESNRQRVAADADDWDDYATWSESQQQQAIKQTGKPFSNLEMALKATTSPSAATGTQPALRVSPLLLAALNFLNAAVDASLATNGNKHAQVPNNKRGAAGGDAVVGGINGFHLSGEYLTAFGELLGTRGGARVPLKGQGGIQEGARTDAAFISYMYRASGLMMGLAADRCEEKLSTHLQRSAKLRQRLQGDNAKAVLDEAIDALGSDGETMDPSNTSPQQLVLALDARERSLANSARSLRAQYIQLLSTSSRSLGMR